MKKIIALILSTVMLLAVASVGSMPHAVSSDPADGYVPLVAANEDTTLQMWFDHTTHKYQKDDITSSGKNTYTIYMGKNEMEGCQFILYSADTAKTDLSAQITQFTDVSSNTLETTMFKEDYVTLEKLDPTCHMEEGETPDPLLPYTAGTAFSLTAGETQAFYIKVKALTDSAAGDYTATLTIKDSVGNEIKKATVFLRVWNFVVRDNTSLATAFYLSSLNITNLTTATYEEVYNYFLDNRICAFNMPSQPYLAASEVYLNNPRVTSFRIGGFGYNDNNENGRYSSSRMYTAAYTRLSSNSEWKKKAYFYTVDEPMSQAQQSAIGNSNGQTILDVKAAYEEWSVAFPGVGQIVPFHENHPYEIYNESTRKYDVQYASDGKAIDALRYMMDGDYIQYWCPKTNAYTPTYALEAINYDQTFATAKLRNLNWIISGNPLGTYCNWDNIYGTFETRIHNYFADREANGMDLRNWWYCAGNNGGYAYTNIIIDNTGVQNKLLFWQSRQYNIEGLLYYHMNEWTYKGTGGEYADDTTSYPSNRARVSMSASDGTYNSGYGNGILFYTGEQAGTTDEFIGTLRVENIRDGIEDYEMLTMYGELAGETAMQNVISAVSTDLVTYTEDDDLVASTRISLGNSLDALLNGGEHTHTYDDGVITTAPTCTVDGVKTYTCSGCGDTYTEPVPATGHTYDTGVITTAPTYTAKGVKTYTCSVCGNTYTEEVEMLTPIIGDLTQDGNVNALDLLKMKLYLTGKVTLNSVQTIVGDTTHDSTLNALDLLRLKLYLTGKITTM